MARQAERAHTGRALAMVGLGVALAIAVMWAALQGLASDDAHLVSSPDSTPAVSHTTADPARPATMPSETQPTLVPEGGYGGDAQENVFYDWAARHRVGSLNLPGMDPGGGQLADVATGFCDLLSDEPGGSGPAVAARILTQTGATLAESRELLERSVAAFCPQKARHLV